MVDGGDTAEEAGVQCLKQQRNTDHLTFNTHQTKITGLKAVLKLLYYS